MPVSTTSNHNEPFDIQMVTRELIATEVIAAQRALYLAPDHDATRPVLWDARKVDVKSGFTEMLNMVEGSTDLWRKMAGGRSAILVAERAHAAYGRLYAQLAAAMPRELQVFTDYDEAVSWMTQRQ